MNKTEFVKYVLEHSGMQNNEDHKEQKDVAAKNEDYKAQKDVIAKSVDAFFSSIREALVRGERVEIRGLGAFSAKSYKPYMGRNPRTGERLPVSGKRIPVFRPGKTFKDILNTGDASTTHAGE